MQSVVPLIDRIQQRTIGDDIFCYEWVNSPIHNTWNGPELITIDRIHLYEKKGLRVVCVAVCSFSAIYRSTLSAFVMQTVWLGDFFSHGISNFLWLALAHSQQTCWIHLQWPSFLIPNINVHLWISSIFLATERIAFKCDV